MKDTNTKLHSCNDWSKLTCSIFSGYFMIHDALSWFSQNDGKSHCFCTDQLLDKLLFRLSAARTRRGRSKGHGGVKKSGASSRGRMALGVLSRKNWLIETTAFVCLPLGVLTHSQWLQTNSRCTAALKTSETWQEEPLRFAWSFENIRHWPQVLCSMFLPKADLEEWWRMYLMKLEGVEYVRFCGEEIWSTKDYKGSYSSLKSTRETRLFSHGLITRWKIQIRSCTVVTIEASWLASYFQDTSWCTFMIFIKWRKITLLLHRPTAGQPPIPSECCLNPERQK